MRGTMIGSFWALFLGAFGLATASLLSDPPNATVETGNVGAEVAASGSDDSAGASPQLADDVEIVSEAEGSADDGSSNGAGAASATETAVEGVEGTASEVEVSEDTETANETGPEELDNQQVEIASAENQQSGETGTEVAGGAAGESPRVAQVAPLETDGEPSSIEVSTEPPSVTEPEIPVEPASGNVQFSSEAPPASDPNTPEISTPPAFAGETPPQVDQGGSSLTPAAQALLDAARSSGANPSQQQAEAGEPPELAVADGALADVPEQPVANAAVPVAPAVDDENSAVAGNAQTSTDEEAGPSGGPDTASEEGEEVAQAETEVVATGAGPVRINRLGTRQSEPVENEAEALEAEREGVENSTSERFAATFDNPNGLPLLAFVLVDDGSVPDAAARVGNLPFPVAVVLDPSRENATERMAAFRSAGVDLGFRALLPVNATAADVEVTLEAAINSLPEATFLFSDGKDGLQQSRTVISQVVDVLSAENLGFVLTQRGLGNSIRAAAEANVPAAEIERDLQTAEEKEAPVWRSLDQSAFRARQAGNAVVVLPLSSFMLAALTVWEGNVDQGQIALAPVSAVFDE